MTLTNVKLERFTAFDSLDLNLSPGINVFVGANGTGKTHLMKVCYAACDVSKKPDVSFADQVGQCVPTFWTFSQQDWSVRSAATALSTRSDRGIQGVLQHNSSLQCLSVARGPKQHALCRLEVCEHWHSFTRLTAFIFRLKRCFRNATRISGRFMRRGKLHFEEIYADVLDRAYLPPPRGPAKDSSRRKLLNPSCKEAVDGKVAIENEEFYSCRNRAGKAGVLSSCRGFAQAGDCCGC